MSSCQLPGISALRPHQLILCQADRGQEKKLLSNLVFNKQNCQQTEESTNQEQIQAASFKISTDRQTELPITVQPRQ